MEVSMNWPKTEARNGNASVEFFSNMRANIKIKNSSRERSFFFVFSFSEIYNIAPRDRRLCCRITRKLKRVNVFFNFLIFGRVYLVTISFTLEYRIAFEKSRRNWSTMIIGTFGRISMLVPRNHSRQRPIQFSRRNIHKFDCVDVGVFFNILVE